MRLPRKSWHACWRFASLVALGWAGVAGGLARADGDPPACELRAVGSDEILWLITGTQPVGQQEPVQQFFYRDKVTTRIRPVLQIPPQVGSIQRAAVVGEALHVFFASGTHYRYTTLGARREIRLPDHVVPEAVAGDSGAKPPRLWVVVAARTADAVERDWHDRLRRLATEPANEDGETGPGDRAPLPASQPVDRTEGTYHLVQYDGTCWQPGPAAPDACGSAERLWLAGGADRRYLLWQHQAADAEVHCAWYERDRWTTGPSIRLSNPPQAAFAAIINTQLFFSVLLDDPADPQQLPFESRVWLPGTEGSTSGRWEPGPPLHAEQGKPLRLPLGSAVGAFADQFVFVRTVPEQVEVGFWPTTGGPPIQAFQKLPVPQASRGPEPRGNPTDLMAMLVLGAVVFLLFWRRRESVTYPVPLPAGLLVAGLARRAAAAVIDVLPAAAVMIWGWFEPITRFGEEVREAWPVPEQLETLVVPEALFWAWLTFRLVYAAYCTVFELLSAATPGKRLLGCSVLSESLARPSAAQIAIRNATRLVELERYLLIWPFLLVVLMTRNRQRLGDLLARTIVVEGRVPPRKDADSLEPADQDWDFPKDDE